MKEAPRLLFACLAGLLMFVSSCGQEQRSTQTTNAAEETAIRQVLGEQEKAWNEGKIEEFMAGYWQSDSLQFVGTRITRGWQATLDRYKTTYPDRAAMGTLHFEFYRFAFIAQESCLVTGRYTLLREADEPTGMFTLLLKKMGGKWLIVYDHTS